MIFLQEAGRWTKKLSYSVNTMSRSVPHFIYLFLLHLVQFCVPTSPTQILYVNCYFSHVDYGTQQRHIRHNPYLSEISYLSLLSFKNKTLFYSKQYSVVIWGFSAYWITKGSFRKKISTLHFTTINISSMKKILYA